MHVCFLSSGHGSLNSDLFEPELKIEVTCANDQIAENGALSRCIFYAT